MEDDPVVVVGAPMWSRAILSDPLLVSISAVYVLVGSMIIGGAESKRWVFGLEPSAAGTSGAMVHLLVGWGSTCRLNGCAGGR
jgi:hypothetical protein